MEANNASHEAITQAVGVDLVSILNLILTLLLLVVATTSAIYAYKAYAHHKERTAKECACDIAKYYGQTILFRYSFLHYVLSINRMVDRIKELFPYECLNDFSLKELERLLENYDMTIDKYEEWHYDNLTPDSLIHAHLICRAEPIHIPNNEKLIPDVLLADFEKEASSLLNELEWFAMSCRYGIADESLLYQSLHQSYLSAVWELYFFIARINANNEDKYYTNLVWLFKKWKSRLEKIQRKGQVEKTLAEIDVHRAQERADQAGSKIYSGKSI